MRHSRSQWAFEGANKNEKPDEAELPLAAMEEESSCENTSGMGWESRKLPGATIASRPIQLLHPLPSSVQRQ